MVYADILSNAQSLARPQQLRLIQELAAGLAHAEDASAEIEPGRVYPVLLPLPAFEAAAVLLKELDRTEASS